MKKFLKYICLFSFLLLLSVAGFEYMLRQIPNPYLFKKHLLENKGTGIKNMIIGSSVVDYGINPAYLPDSTYNLAISSQSPRYNQAILEKYINDLPHLKNVIWGLCYQILWRDEYEQGVFPQDNKADNEIASYNIYMDICFDNNPLHYSEVLSGGPIFEKWSKYYLLHGETVHCDSLGLDHTYDFVNKGWQATVANIVKKGHTRLKNEKAAKVFSQNVQRMNEVAKLCHDKGINLYIVIPPTYKDYYELADNEQLQQMYSAIKNLASQWENVFWYDYLKDSRFNEEDFHDGNHLTSDTGAKKFAIILRKDIWGKEDK